MKKSTVAMGVVALLTAFATGCGATNSVNQTTNTTAAKTVSNQTTQTSSQKTMIVGGQSYAGKEKLASLEKTANQNPKDAKAQIQAGISAYVNQDFQASMAYYKKAIAADPSNVVAYNNLGNVYFRGLKQPKNALAYYQKATEVNKTYAYGWWNLALCQQALGDKAGALTTVKQGLSSVSKSDPNYKNLQALEKSLA